MEQKTEKRKKTIRLMRQHHMLVAGIVIPFLLVMLVLNIVIPDRAFSDTENRSLAQYPSANTSALTDGSWFQDFDAWYSDQFFLRNQWIRLQFTGLSLLGKKEINGVYIGKKGYHFQNPEIPDEELVSRTIQAVNAFAEQYSGIHTYMMVVPDASQILEDKLPASVSVRDQLQDIANFEAQLSSNIQVLDVTDVLKEHAADYIYYKTDHHWTTYGAGLAFSEAASAMGLSDSGGTAYPVTDSFRGTLSSKCGDMRSTDEIDLYKPSNDTGYYVVYQEEGVQEPSMYKKEALDEKDKYQIFFGGNHPLIEIDTAADTNRRLLVFKDSYANCFMQYITPYFEKIIMVDPRYYYDDVGTLAGGSGITDILYLYSGDIILTDTSLADALESAGN